MMINVCAQEDPEEDPEEEEAQRLSIFFFLKKNKNK